MPTILCYGDSNTWGCVPGSFDPVTGLSKRYDRRWPCFLKKDFRVIEEAINGRTTNLDETIPNRPYKNGLSLLSPALEANYPIDIVVFMLGTNDTKKHFKRSENEIAEGLGSLIKLVKSSNKGVNGKAPKILIIAPQPIVKASNLHPMLDDDSIRKSKKLNEIYQKLAKEEGCEFLDASLKVTSSHVDGVHLDEEGHEILGKKVCEVVKQMCGQYLPECLLSRVEQQEIVAKEFGFYWENLQQLIEQIQNECLEIQEAWDNKNASHLQEEVGDLMQAAVSLAIFCKLDPHETLLKSIEKFQKRYDAVVQLAKNDGLKDLHHQSTETLMKYWNQAKLYIK